VSEAKWQDLIISNDDELVKELLSQSHSIAVVGMKPDTYKPSYYVPKYMLDHGYEIIPVNPGVSEIEQLKCYPDLASLPHPADIVQVFRRSADVLPHAQEALAVKPRAFWMQSGIINEAAAELLAKAGIKVVMDRCMYVDHMKFFGRR
jgi:uncharacterized protein